VKSEVETWNEQNYCFAIYAAEKLHFFCRNSAKNFELLIRKYSFVIFCFLDLKFLGELIIRNNSYTIGITMIETPCTGELQSPTLNSKGARFFGWKH
jgi:hypothetical protein